MITLNMLPDVKREFIRTRRLQTKVIALAILASAVALGLVALLALWVYGAQALQKNNLTQSINKNLADLKSVKDIDKYITIQNQLNNIASLHESKGIYSRLFDILPKLNPVAPNSVKINTLEVDGVNKTATFEGQTTTFTALQTFRDTLQNAKLSYRLLDTTENAEPEALFSSVKIEAQGIGKTQEGQVIVSFKILTTYNELVFERAVTINDVLVPNKETTQSTIDAPNVFGQSEIITEEIE
ncbi:MAG: hypothetical protein ABIR46_01750 [Candidatus Saccharimonadales bacterium]